MDLAPELCQKGDFFPEKEDENLFMFWNLYIVTLYKMQNISTLLCIKFEI